ncbi:Methylcrotonoyl-CoA carboxylase beta chain [Acropora cervicornis]|uniref:Methylcrotonoyl-CoA carboxylase beta chain n=1 Tax=Acropora cervicornis TaxID=6130 RepID=A0AAD9VD42_ACRCE|nr:Methylcrotonoyl-CoA carboxylase beta chain [Acropora cervicornis]
MNHPLFCRIFCVRRVFTNLLASPLIKAVGAREASNGNNFQRICSFLDKNNPEFLAKIPVRTEVLKNFEDAKNKALQGGGQKAIERHTKRNKKLLVRERIDKLLDKGSHFLELSQFAGLNLEYGDVPCAGVVSGIGEVSGRLCVIIANDATVKGGTIYPIAVKKQLRAQEVAKADIFPETGGRVFYNEAVMSMNGIPTVCVVCGSCTAGAAYVPTMADEAAATGEVVTAEELGALAKDPLHDAEDLLTLALYDSAQFPIYEILARVVDGSQFQEFKAKFGSTLITGFAYVSGHLVGIVANNGFLSSQASLKEQACLIKDQAKMMSAVACAEVPKITVVMKGSFGPSSYALCGRSFDPHFLFTWPTATVAMDTVKGMAERCCFESGIEDDESSDEKQKEFKDTILKKGSQLLTMDQRVYGMTVLELSLRAALSSFPNKKSNKFGVFRM